ncbi:MAG TPA: ferrochelatase [Terracidiphilus sp.]|jgi:ferrochelatase|nr:ferrochelatase [Terracidiphilus sp.]
MAKQAVLLLAHGTPETIEQIPAYLRNVVSGRPLPQHLIEEIQRRYALIGHSPLTEITLEQGRLVEAELAAAGEQIPVYVAMRNWRPYIPDVIKKMRADGVEEVAALCLAPQNSRTSVGLYRRAVEAESAGLRIDFTEGWAQHPLLIEAFAERLRPAFTRLRAEAGAPVPVLFTAHSVPSRTIQATEGQAADPYAEDAKQTAALVAERVPEIPQWWFAFQSQGASGGEWIGPSVEETLESIAASGVRTLLLQPIGFLCDHVEILYDVDILFREFAARLNLRLERPESLNASGTLARAIADLARKGLVRLNSH